MKTKIYLIFLLFLINNVGAQNLILTGKVYSMNPKIDKIYYAASGKKFTATNFVKVSSDRKYTFTISIARIKEKEIEDIFFTTDTTANQEDENACIHRIHVMKIVNSPLFKSSKNIQLESNLRPEDYCTMTAGHDEFAHNFEKFQGIYNLSSGDTIRSIEINERSSDFTSKIDKITPKYMSEEFGTWTFNAEAKQLIFRVEEQRNKEFGTSIYCNRTWTFEVQENENILAFSNQKGYKLVKVNNVSSYDQNMEGCSNLLPDEVAQFPGGKSAMMKFIVENIKYPSSKADEHVTGKCYIEFCVFTDGSLHNIRVVRGIVDCPECDREAIKLVKKMPNWIPAKQNGIAVSSKFILPIMFGE